MNLPSAAIGFLDAAVELLRPEGGLIHYYAFAAREDGLSIVRNAFRLAIERTGKKVQSFMYERAIKEVAPNRVQVALDALVK